MARKGIPRGISFWRAPKFWMSPVFTNCDEYLRLTFNLCIPYVAGVTFHRGKLCADDLMREVMEFHYSRGEVWVERRFTRLSRLYAMWDLGYRATEKR